jgi:large subunit ribosomal protein L1
MGKKYEEVVKLVDKTKTYTLEEAVKLVKKTAYTNFDSSVELHVNLGVDPKKSDQMVRGVVVLPYGTGKTQRVAVIAKGEKLKEAEKSGADIVGDESLVDKIANGFMDFDVLIATPDVMKSVSKLGKILGPRGLMPNPKSGTVTFDIAKVVKEIKAGRIEFKCDSYGIVHCCIGKTSFDDEKLISNCKEMVKAILDAKPPSTKGKYIRAITICSTMGPGIRVAPETIVKSGV